MSEPDYVAQNRDGWAQTNAEYTDAQADRVWHAEEITWGMFGVPESEIGVLGDVAGLDVIDLGCGTGYFSAWLARHWLVLPDGKPRCAAHSWTPASCAMRENCCAGGRLCSPAS